jgi:polysaccharide biosynthesis/export protein
MRNILNAFILAALTLLISSNYCVAQSIPSSDISDVEIGSGDLLTIGVNGAPEYQRDVRVDARGKVSLPMIGQIKIEGLSPSEAEGAIAQKLQEGGFFNHPQVSVFVKEYAAEGVSILGEVQKPGIYPLLGHRTLLDAISAAGGITPRAGKTVTIAHRNHPEDGETITLSHDEGKSMDNRPVSPGDTIVVSKAGLVYVVGAVIEPMGIIMENSHLTVLQAIAMAHGTTPTASLNSAKVIRKASTNPQEIPIPLKTILSTKEHDVVLQPDDILFVPTSSAKVATHKGLEAILQAATGIAIYGRY